MNWKYGEKRLVGEAAPRDSFREQYYTIERQGGDRP
jgi:hypothetical protein